MFPYDRLLKHVYYLLGSLGGKTHFRDNFGKLFIYFSLQKDSTHLRTYLTIKYLQKVLLPVIHIQEMRTQLFHTHNDQHYIIHSFNYKSCH